MTHRIVFFDCFSGAAGDMILGSLVDAGCPIEEVAADLRQLSCGNEIRLRAERVVRGGLAATKVHVEMHAGHHQHHGHHAHHHEQPGHAHTHEEPGPHHNHGHDHGHGHAHEHKGRQAEGGGQTGHAHRGLPEIRDMIENSSLPERVKRDSIRIFTRLAEAEAAVHNTSVEEVHFHEVGALDAIADVVGSVCALERLRVERIFFSTLITGGGTVTAAHGTLPVPAPATARLIEGFRCAAGSVEAELLTPTGAAILTTLGEQAPPPAMRVTGSGYGAGDAEFEGAPNVLRAMLGEADSAAESDTVWLVEANLDDCTPEVCGYAIERLIEAGALDAFAVPIQMKKTRPGLLLRAIVEPADLPKIERVFFRETTTFGVRRMRMDRSKLARESVTVETEWGAVRVKIGRRQGEVVTVSPEYEDCRRIALENDLPLRDVMRAAAAAAMKLSAG